MSARPQRQQQPPLWRMALLAIWPVALLLIGVHLFLEASGANRAACEDPRHQFLPDYWLLVGSVAAVVVGRTFGPELHRAPQQRAARQLSDIVGIGAAMLFFATITIVLAYEGVGVQESLFRAAQAPTLEQARAHLAELEPITHYVRCAIFDDRGGANLNATPGLGVWSWITLIIVGFLAGHWLWAWSPPDGPPDTHEKGTSKPAPLWLGIVVTTVLCVLMLIGMYLLLHSWLDAREQLAQTADSSRTTGDSFRDGVRGVVAIVFAMLVFISGLDFIFGYRRSPSVALRMQNWARTNPWFVFGLLTIIGALFAHFTGNVIHYPNDPDYRSVFQHVGDDHLFVFLGALLAITATLSVKAGGGLAQRSVPWGIVQFELAGNAKRATQIVGAWRATRKLPAALPALLWDFVFIVSYVLTLVLACFLATRWLTGQVSADQEVFTGVGTLFIVLSVAAGVFDVMEDLALIRILRAFDNLGADDAPAPAEIEGPAGLARFSALAKFALLILVVLFVTSACGVALGQLEHTTLGG